MKRTVLNLVAVAFLGMAAGVLAQGTAFTYQGRLNDGGNPASGIYDLRFAIYDALTNGTQQGNALTNSATAVNNGLFTVTLDFGNQFPGANRWLDMAVRTNGAGAFAPLSPRQLIATTPYAVQAANAVAANAVTGPVAASQLTGTLSPNNIAAGSITGTMLATGSVSRANLADGSISFEKLQTIYAGSLLTTFSGSGLFGQSVLYDPSSGILAIDAPSAIAPWGIGNPNAPTSAVNGVIFQFDVNGTLLNTLFDVGTTSFVEEFGYAMMSFNGNYLVGSPNYATSGRAYLRNAGIGNGTVFANPGPTGADRFGEAVASWFSTYPNSAIGAPRKNIPVVFSGVVHLFNNFNGALSATLTNPVPTGNAYFGSALLAFGGAGLFVGAPGGGAGSSGVVYFYPNLQASQAATVVFTNPAPTVYDNFGQSLAAMGTARVLIGAPNDDAGATDAGAAYLFNTNGTLLTTFLNPAPATNGWFGKAITAVGSDKVLISAPGNGSGGVVYLFNTNGTLLGIYKNPRAMSGDSFGWSLAPVGTDRVLVGAPTANAAYLLQLFSDSYVSGLSAEHVLANSITTASLADGAVTAQKVSGVLNDTQLSANIARLSGQNQVFTGRNTFSDPLNTFAGDFSGNGFHVTNVFLQNIRTGKDIQLARLTLASSPGAGLAPYATATGDVNGDGFPDLISVQNSPNAMAILTNNGAGQFGYFSSPFMNAGPRDVVAGDFNGDGFVDLATAHYFDGGIFGVYKSVNIRLNNGSGGFALAQEIPVGVEASSLAVAHFNGDTNLDIVCMNYGSATVTVLTNNGSGHFTSAGAYFVGTTPFAVAAGDLNGDGKAEIIVANFNSSPTVLINQGSGALFSASPFPRFLQSLDAVFSDFNGDGKNDVAFAGGGTIAVYFGNGNGGFSSSNYFDVGGYATSIAAVDLTGTGKRDLVCAVDANSVRTFLNDGGGHFYPPAVIPVGSTPGRPQTADVNGDGRIDIVSGNSGSANYSVLLNSTVFNGTFAGNGASLTSLNAGQLTTGTVPDARLSTNVALRAGGNAFTGNQTVLGGNVGVGTTNPARRLTVQTATEDYGLEHTDGAKRLSTYLGQGGAWLGTVSADPLFFFVNDGQASVTLDTTGNVGIGTASPVKLLQVGSSAVPGSEGMIHLASRAPLSSAARDWQIGVPRPGENAVGIAYSFNIHDTGLTYPSQFLVQWGSGNVGIANTNPTQLLVVGNAASPAYCNGTTWVNGSDRNAKEDFAAVDAQEILARVAALSIQSWSYKAQPGHKHVGPMAQDFHAAFGLNGSDDKHISTVDEGGVALAAIQGLNEKVEGRSQRSEVRIEKLETENAELKARLEKLERFLTEKSAR